MENKRLFLCNSVYQTLVAIWLRYHDFPDDPCDLILSDHSKGGRELAEKLRSSGVFRRVWFAETLEEARNRVRHSRMEVLLGNLMPYRMLRRQIPLEDNYTDVYFANFDKFSQIFVNALFHRNPATKLHVFEDGLSTYCLFEQYYLDNRDYYGKKPAGLKAFLHRRIYRLRTIYGNLSEVLVFNPDCMQWDPGCPVVGMDKMSGEDEGFRRLVIRIFDYEASEDRYDRRYLFLEESFFADGFPVNDVELVEQLSAAVGRDNLMVKIHPRNPSNRFAGLGYKTNRDTTIPWEVILMNMGDVSDKVLITVASSTILNPIMIFGMPVRAYSLYPCLTTIPPVLEGKYWEFLNRLFEKYSDMITICNSVAEIP